MLFVAQLAQLVPDVPRRGGGAQRACAAAPDHCALRQSPDLGDFQAPAGRTLMTILATAVSGDANATGIISSSVLALPQPLLGAMQGALWEVKG